MSRRLEDGCTVEHLHQSSSTQNGFWNYPSPYDIKTVSKEQITPCKIDRDWEPTNNTYLKNSSEIENTFKRLMNLYLMHQCSCYLPSSYRTYFTRGLPQ